LQCIWGTHCNIGSKTVCASDVELWSKVMCQSRKFFALWAYSAQTYVPHQNSLGWANYSPMCHIQHVDTFNAACGSFHNLYKSQMAHELCFMLFMNILILNYFYNISIFCYCMIHDYCRLAISAAHQICIIWRHGGILDCGWNSHHCMPQNCGPGCCSFPGSPLNAALVRGPRSTFKNHVEPSIQKICPSLLYIILLHHQAMSCLFACSFYLWLLMSPSSFVVAVCLYTSWLQCNNAFYFDAKAVVPGGHQIEGMIDWVIQYVIFFSVG